MEVVAEVEDASTALAAALVGGPYSLAFEFRLGEQKRSQHR